jgi:Fe-S-cluster-containing dehydrogenase component
MCYDRTSIGKRPMCATVCPSEALYFGPMEEWKARRRGRPVNHFRFGRQLVRTKVYMVMPETDSRDESRQGTGRHAGQSVNSSGGAMKIDVRIGEIKRQTKDPVEQ